MTVEFNVPVPARRDKYGIGDLPVNGSKFIPVPEGKSREHVCRALYAHATRHGKRFVCRQWTQDDITGVRVWRFS
jgi:hypothetical protein